MNSGISYIVPCLLPMVMAFSSCSENDSKQAQEPQKGVLEVEVCKPVRQDVEVTREWAGAIEADSSGAENQFEVVFSISETEWLNYFAPMMREKKLSKHPFTVIIAGDDSKAVTLPANIWSLNSAFDQATGTLSARAKILKPSDRLIAGTVAKVKTVLGVLKNATVVPEEALVKVHAGYCLVGADEAKGTTYLVSVNPGESEGDLIVIKNDLPADMLVVTKKVNEAYGYSFINPDAFKARLVVKLVDRSGQEAKK